MKKESIKKSERLLKILDILNRHKTLTTAEVIERFCNSNNITDKNKEKRNILRDLIDLNEQGRIHKSYYDPTTDREILSDIIPQNSYNKWAIAGYENEIIGSGILEFVGATFEASPSIRSELIISNTIRKSTQSIYFNILGKIFCITLSKDIYPFKLIIRRSKEPSETVEKISNTHGRRLAVLSIPIESVSSCKSEDQPGHCIIEFLSETNILIKDLKSKNYTYIYSLKQNLNELILSNTLKSANGSTINLQKKGENEKGEKIESSVLHSCNPPCKVTLGQFTILIGNCS